MKKILFALAIVLALPVASLAATYQYVNTSGTIQMVTADTASQALTAATNRDPASGVMLYSGSTYVYTAPNGITAAYHFVDSNQVVQTIMAVSAQDALNRAPNIDVNSGVKLSTGLLQNGVSVSQQ